MASKVLLCRRDGVPSVAVYDANTLTPCEDNGRWGGLLLNSSSYMNTLEASPDGKLVALRQQNDGIGLRVVDLDTMSTIALPGVAATDWPGRYCALWSPDSTKLALGLTAAPYLRVFSIADGVATPVTVTQPPVAIGAMAWSPDGTKLACSAWTDGAHNLWYHDTTTWAITTPTTQPDYPPTALAWSASSAHILSGRMPAEPPTLQVHVVADWSTISIATLPSQEVQQIEVSPDGAWVGVRQGLTGQVVAYSFPGMVLQTVSAQPGNSDWIAFTPDSAELWNFSDATSPRIMSYPVSTWVRGAPSGSPTVDKLTKGQFSNIPVRQLTTGAGQFLDDAGAAAVGRKVRIYDRASGVMLIEKTTDASGKFSATPLHSGAPVDIRVLDDDAGTQHDDLCFARVVPAVVP